MGGDGLNATGAQLGQQVGDRSHVPRDGRLRPDELRAQREHERGLGPPGVGVDVAPGDPGRHPTALGLEGAGGAGERLGVAAVPRDQHHRAERVGGPDELDHHVLERVLADDRVPANPACSPLEP